MNTIPPRGRWKARPSIGVPALLAAIGAGALVSAWSAPSMAAYTWATCPTSGYGAQIPMSLGAFEYTKQTTSPPGVAPDMSLYNHNTLAYWWLHTNGNVLYLKPYLGHFETESFYDYLRVTEMWPAGSAPPSATHTYTGLLNSSTTTSVAASDQWLMNSGPTNPFQVGVEWKTDYSVAPYTPSRIVAAAPQCHGFQQPTVSHVEPIVPNDRRDGLLIGTGDTLYFGIYQPANTPLVISVDALVTTAGGDFDVYASTQTSQPDAQTAQWSAQSTRASEALWISPVSTSRSVYVGVHSYSGAGHFVIHGYHTNAVSTNRVCVEGTLSSSKLTQLKDGLRKGSATLLGYTNGNLWRRHYTILQNHSGCDEDECEVCAVDDGGTVSYGKTTSSSVCGQIEWHSGKWSDGTLFAHESGHSCYGFPDEYSGPPSGSSTPRHCGHTVMANNGLATGLCSVAHCKDGNINPPCQIGTQSNWRIIKDHPAYTFYGPDHDGYQLTGDATPVWNNETLRNLVTIN
ncbi:MAG: hypothetical protein R3B70_47555 [Polyangiaceae bacterium]